mmetsp:Transcript_15356/g.29707  ORF Transcript_15356/g.29707 Transcript_15356/m.29707 type:complete len:84 (-) Transcript_15356:636-887(-)
MAKHIQSAADSSIHCKDLIIAGPSASTLGPDGRPVPQAHRAHATAPAAELSPQLTKKVPASSATATDSKATTSAVNGPKLAPT